MKAVVFTMAYNAEKTLKRTIDSILNQTFSDFEYYIIDNGSSDSTLDIIVKYSKIDKRVIPLNFYNNDPTAGWAVFRTLINSTTADYIVWCDADDEYTLDFLENMIEFADKNNLDIAACGYDKINSATNKIEKHRALEKSLIIHDKLFADEFINYRGFISYLWGKLYSVSFLRKVDYPRPHALTRICDDVLWTLDKFRKAKRVGIYPKAMYKYYQYDKSFSHENIAYSLSSYKELWEATKNFLEDYGEISKINTDFLYAIYLSLVEEMVDNIFGAELDVEKKLNIFENVFNDDIWKETISREINPKFSNLKRIKEYISSLKTKIIDLYENENTKVQIERLFSYIDGKNS